MDPTRDPSLPSSSNHRNGYELPQMLSEIDDRRCLLRTQSSSHASGPRAVRTSGADGPRRFAGPVTAKIKMDEAYRLSAYPNPAREQATVELAVKERQEVAMHLYDVLGRRVATLHDGPMPAQELKHLRLDVSATGLTNRPLPHSPVARSGTSEIPPAHSHEAPCRYG